MKKRMFESYPDVVTVNELCEMLDISKKLAYRILNSQDIRSVKVGRIYRIPKAAIIEFLTNERK